MCNTFFVIDEIDIVVFNMLMRNSSDFKKLHELDQRTLIWFIIKFPRGVASFIDYLGKQYEGEYLNVVKLSEDVEAIP